MTGVSADRLTVFVGDCNFGTGVFVRDRLGGEFIRMTPGVLPACHVLPVSQDCSLLLGVRTPGGCGAEEVVTLVADSALEALPAASSLSLQVDRVGSTDGALVPDGARDGVFRIPVQGPLTALLLVMITSSGTPLPQQWDTLVGDQAVPAIVSYWIDARGGVTPGLGVEEQRRMLNQPDGSLAPLRPGRHDLVLYAHDIGLFTKGSYLRVSGLRPDGSVVNGPIFAY